MGRAIWVVHDRTSLSESTQVSKSLDLTTVRLLILTALRVPSRMSWYTPPSLSLLRSITSGIDIKVVAFVAFITLKVCLPRVEVGLRRLRPSGLQRVEHELFFRQGTETMLEHVA